MLVNFIKLCVFFVLIMATNRTLRVDSKDLKRMMVDCRDIFLIAHPEMEHMKLTQKFMFNKLVNFYLGKKNN